MLLFVGVTILALAMAAFYSAPEGIQLYRGAGEERSAGRYRGGLTRQQARNLWVCAGIYVVLSALSACRIASGNDYWVYTNMFNLISQGRHVSSEFGFNALVRFMQFFLEQKGTAICPYLGCFPC